MKTYGGVEVYFHLSLSSALDGNEVSKTLNHENIKKRVVTIEGFFLYKFGENKINLETPVYLHFQYSIKADEKKIRI
jgi:hypothetical protein